MAAVAFDPLTGEIDSHGFNQYARLDSIGQGSLDSDTVAWWLTQSGGARGRMSDGLLGQGDAAVNDLVNVLVGFSSWFQLSQGKEIWSHGATFDIPILASAFGRVGMDVPWTYRAPRDTRTLYSFSGGAPDIPFEGEEHDALADAAHQARQVSAAMNGLVKAGLTIE